MIQSATYRQFWSVLLLLCFLLPLGVSEVHHLTEHAEEQAHCIADGNNKHIHDEEFAAHHCFLCAVKLSEYAPPAVNFYPVKPSIFFSSSKINLDVFIPRQTTFSHLQRGPPSIALC